VGAACQRPGPGLGEARLVLDDGDAVAGPYRDGSIVRRGAVVEARRGEPQLELSRRHRRLTLRPGTKVRLDDRVEVLRGDVLSFGETSFEAGVARVEADGVVRVTRSLASSVRVYRGEAAVSSAGRRLTVPALRDASVPALGLVPVAPTWVRWDRRDAWDSRHLGAVIDLTDQLESGGRSFASALRGAPAVDVASVISGVPAAAWQDALARYTPDEAVVGGAIAAVAGDPLPRVFALRATGAAWGIVAVERAGGDPARAVRLLYDALGRWAARTGVSGVHGRPGALFGAGSVGAPAPAPGGSPSSPPAPSGAGGSASPAPATTAAPPSPVATVPPAPTVTVPAVTVPTITAPPAPLPTVIPQTAPPLVPELP
jgi:hypothetical protein